MFDFVDLFILGLSIYGLFILKWALTKWRVLTCAPLWKPIKAKLVNKELKVITSKSHITSDDSRHRFRSSDVKKGFFFDTVVSKEYIPIIEFEYEWDGVKYKSNNLAHYNRKLIWSNEDEASALLERYNYNEPLIIKVNPSMPKEFYFDRKHFPFVWASIQLMIGMFMSIGLAIILETICNILGINEPKIHDRSIVVYAVPAFSFGYLIANRIKTYFS